MVACLRSWVWTKALLLIGIKVTGRSKDLHKQGPGRSGSISRMHLQKPGAVIDTDGAAATPSFFTLTVSSTSALIFCAILSRPLTHSGDRALAPMYRATSMANVPIPPPKSRKYPSMLSEQTNQGKLGEGSCQCFCGDKFGPIHLYLDELDDHQAAWRFQPPNTRLSPPFPNLLNNYHLPLPSPGAGSCTPGLSELS